MSIKQDAESLRSHVTQLLERHLPLIVCTGSTEEETFHRILLTKDGFEVHPDNPYANIDAWRDLPLGVLCDAMNKGFSAADHPVAFANNMFYFGGR